MVSDEKIFKLERYYARLSVSLSNYLDMQKVMSKLLEDIKVTSAHLLEHKDGSTAEWWKSLPLEERQRIEKIARFPSCLNKMKSEDLHKSEETNEK